MAQYWWQVPNFGWLVLLMVVVGIVYRRFVSPPEHRRWYDYVFSSFFSIWLYICYLTIFETSMIFELHR